MTKTTPDEYKTYAASISPKSKHLPNLLRAFVGGGAICVIGQLVLEFWLARLPDSELAFAATSVTMIFAGILLTALGIYDKLAKFGKAGTLVPITGFSNSIASPAMEFKSEGMVAGLAAKMFIIAGPVIVYGLAASALYGIVYFLGSR